MFRSIWKCLGASGNIYEHRRFSGCVWEHPQTCRNLGAAGYWLQLLTTDTAGCWLLSSGLFVVCVVCVLYYGCVVLVWFASFRCGVFCCVGVCVGLVWVAVI